MSDIYLSATEVNNIVAYCSEEVRRQQDGPLNVGYMVDAWMDALDRTYDGDELSLALVERWGTMVEPQDNWMGFRNGDVWIAGRLGTRVDRLDYSLKKWEGLLPNMTPLEAYKEFEFIHPFFDGNGRTGKIILNYLNGTMLDPIFPPSDLFGEYIENP